MTDTESNKKSSSGLFKETIGNAFKNIFTAIKGFFPGNSSLDYNDRWNRLVALMTAIISIGIGRVIFLSYLEINIRALTNENLEYTASLFIIGGVILLLATFFTSPKKNQKRINLRVLGTCMTIIFCCYAGNYASITWHITVSWISYCFQVLPAIVVWIFYSFILIYEVALLFFDLKNPEQQ